MVPTNSKLEVFGRIQGCFYLRFLSLRNLTSHFREIMSSFTFGAQGTTASATPVTGNLFGAVSKPLFGTSTTTVQTAGMYFVI